MFFNPCLGREKHPPKNILTRKHTEEISGSVNRGGFPHPKWRGMQGRVTRCAREPNALQLKKTHAGSLLSFEMPCKRFRPEKLIHMTQVNNVVAHAENIIYSTDVFHIHAIWSISTFSMLRKSSAQRVH